MTTKHSPGPWYVGSGTYEGRNIYSTAFVTDDEGFTYQPVVATAEDNEVACWDANARLIAAAPDLLEACETFAEWLGREESGFARAGNKRDTPEGERAWRDWYNENLRLCALAQEQARAAIARATGEQP